MKSKRAVDLLEKAVRFYIQTNLEFSANLHKNGAEDEERAEMREAIELATKALLPKQTRMKI